MFIRRVKSKHPWSKPLTAWVIGAISMTMLPLGAPIFGAQLDAVWIGETGDWSVPGNWEPAAIPLNDATNTYNVLIDDGDVLTASVTTLSVNATVDNLTLDVGDTLLLPNIRILTIASGPLAGTLSNAGEIQLGSIGNFTDIRFDGGLVALSGGGTILLTNNANNRLMGTSGGSLLNVDNIIRGAGQIGVNATLLTNEGTIIADQPLELLIDPTSTPMINTGILRAESGGTLRLSNGDFNNLDGVIEAADASLVELSAVTISGGTLATTGSGVIRTTSATTLDSTVSPLTNAGDLESTNGVDISVFGDLQNTGTITLNAVGTSTDLELNDAEISLAGGGTVAMGDNANNRIIGVNGGSLVNVDNTIRGSGQIGVNTMTLTNHGTIVADQAAELAIDPMPDMVNDGTLRADAGATLRLVNGIFNNATGIIEAMDASAVELTAATMNGGVYQVQGTGLLRAVGATQLNGDVVPITLLGPLEIQNGAVITLRGTIENNLRINLNSTGINTDLKPTDGPVTLTGGGLINLSNSTSNRINSAAGGSLINLDNTIRGSGQIGANVADITNHAMIVADQSATLTIDPATNPVVNTGILRAQLGATLRLVNGVFNNADGSIEAFEASFVDVSIATFNGGEFATMGTGVIRVSPAATFDGAADAIDNYGRIELTNNADVVFRGALNNSGVIHIASTGSFTDFEPTGGPLTLSGGGQITMSNNFNNRILGVTGGSLINVNNAISGSGQIGFNVTPITNQGSIIANQTAAVTINADNTTGLNNSGTLQATNGATMNIGDGPFTTSGSILADASSTISRTGGITQTAGAMVVSGALSATGAINIQGGALSGSGTVTGSVTNSGTVAPGSSAGQLSISGTYAQAAAGTFDVEIAGITPGSLHDVLAVGGAATLNGTIRIRFINGFTPTTGQTFTVMTYPSHTGTFSAVDVPCSGVSVNVLPASVVVEIVTGAAFLGDLNCDCAANMLDVEPFVLALLDPAAYGTSFPTCGIARADMNTNTFIDATDVHQFVDLLLP